MQKTKKRAAQALLFVVWIGLITTGFVRLFIYANTSGEAARAPAQWPQETSVARGSEKKTSLVIFAHPHCPCSEASVGELERLMPHLRDTANIFVVFVKPKGLTEDWAKEALWKRAEAIPGVRTLLDNGGVEAAKFGAKTSGQTFLYDPQGQLVFSGGITPARGHMGDSDGRLSILSYLETGKTLITTTPVFGCSLAKPERAVAGQGRTQ